MDFLSHILLNSIVSIKKSGFPPHWKTWKNETTFSSRGKSGNFEKLSKSQGILNESGKSQGKM